MATAQSSSDEAAQISSVPLKQWAAGLVQVFHDITLCYSITQYLIIHQRSLCNHPPASLLPRARILVSREEDYELQNCIEDYRERYRLFKKCTLQSCCDLA